MIKLYDGRENLYQWDLDRKVIVSDPTVTEVHFCNKTGDCSLVTEVYDGIANIPNILLQTDWPIHAYAYCGDCYTKDSTTFKVIKRSKPDDYVYTETEVKRWEALEERVNETLDSVAAAESERNAAEEARAEAEAIRAENEAARVAAEDARKIEFDAMIESLEADALELDNHEKRITQLERHISNDYFVTDNTIAYKKAVGADVCPYAQLNSIGGMTYKCNNILPYPYHQKNITRNGITFTDNGDGSITLNGTATGNAVCYLSANTKLNSLVAGKTYIPSLSNKSIDGKVILMCNYIDDVEGITKNFTTSQVGAKVYPSTAREDTIYLLVLPDVVLNNVTVYPMINEGSTALPYELWYEGLRDTKVTEIKSHGANLFSASMVVGGYVSSSGQFNESSAGEKSFIAKCEPNTTYTLSKLNTTIVRVAGFASEPTNKAQGEMLKEVANNTTTATFTTRNNEYIAVFYLNNTNEANTNEAVISSIMLNEGATALPYKPYREPISYPIPAEIQVGKGVNGYADTIGFDAKKRTQRVNTVVLTGNEAFSVGDFYILTTSMNLPKGLSQFYASVHSEDFVISFSNTQCNNLFFGNSTDSIFNHFADLAEFKAYLAERYASGNPVTYTYALATPIETDISEALEGFESIIEVEGGGSLEFVNEYKNAVPSSITYLLKEGSI